MLIQPQRVILYPDKDATGTERTGGLGWSRQKFYICLRLHISCDMCFCSSAIVRQLEIVSTSLLQCSGNGPKLIQTRNNGNHIACTAVLMAVKTFRDFDDPPDILSVANVYDPSLIGWRF